MTRYLFCILLIWTGGHLLAQRVPKAGQTGFEQIYQFSGIVIGEKAKEPISYVEVRINHSPQGQLANEDGFYSIPVSIRDTIYFSHIAYKTGRLIVADYLKEYKGDKSAFIYVVNYLKEDEYRIGTTYIFPWRNNEEMTTAILNMPVDKSSPEMRARENLDPHVIDAIMQSLDKDGDERIVVGRQMYYNQVKNKNLMPMAGLDVAAAYRILSSIVEKVKEKKQKDLNYWEN